MSNTARRMDFSRFPRRTLLKDDALFVESEESHQMYVLLTGSLGVYRDEVHVATLEDPLSVVGEISALTGKPRNATVRALGVSTLAEIADPDQLFEDYPQFGAKLARTLARRLALMNARFVDVKGLLVRTNLSRVTDLGATPAGPTQRLPPAGDPAWAVAAARVRAEPDAGTVVARLDALPIPLAVTPSADEVMNALADMLDWDPSAST